MIRIEKTEINCAAFIILTSTLDQVQSTEVFEIADNYSSFKIRPKTKDEQQDLTIDLSFLKEIFGKFVRGLAPIVATNEAEKYIKKCSHACYYFRTENNDVNDFDSFDIFHEIHFQNIPSSENDLALLRQFCRLFRIDFKFCLPFENCQENEALIELPPKIAFNEVFKSIHIKKIDSQHQIIFESQKLDMRDSINTLFTIKDLLFSRGFNVTQIPELGNFSIQQNEQVEYSFESENGQKIILTFKYELVKFAIIKNAANKSI